MLELVVLPVCHTPRNEVHLDPESRSTRQGAFLLQRSRKFTRAAILTVGDDGWKVVAMTVPVGSLDLCLSTVPVERNSLVLASCSHAKACGVFTGTPRMSS